MLLITFVYLISVVWEWEGNGVTQSVLFNPALVALNTDKVLHLEYFNRYGVKELGTVGIGLYIRIRCCRQVLISLLSDMISIGKLFFGYR